MLRRLAILFLFLSALTLVTPSCASSGDSHWQRQGLRIIIKSATTLIDVRRANAQQARGCVLDRSVRFGYSAFMRQRAPQLQWSLEQRQALSSAAFLDDGDAAILRIEALLADETLDVNQRAAVENQLLLTSLMFGDMHRFSRALNHIRPDDRVEPAIRADRLFLRAYVLSQSAHDSKDWQRAEQLLVTAQRLDPSFFSIRVQRVVNWLLAHRGSTRNVGCAKMVRELTDLVLDLSDAAPCAQLTGNVSHYLSRVLQDESVNRAGQPVFNPKTPGGQWRLLQTATLAHVTRQDSVKRAAMQALESAPVGPCVGVIRAALTELDR
jgi:hypothetical protein